MIKFNTGLEQCDVDTELVARYQDLGDISSREYLTEKVDNKIRGYAYRLYSDFFRRKVDFDDVLSDCYFGFLKAVESFDRNRGMEFDKYFRHKMRQSVVDGIRERDRGERKAMDLEKLLGAKLYENYSDEELKKMTGWGEKRFDFAMTAFRMKKSCSLYADVKGTGYTLGSMIEDKSSDFIDYVLLKDRVNNVMGEMSERDKSIIKNRINGANLLDIGKEVGLTEAGVCQIVRKFRKKL